MSLLNPRQTVPRNICDKPKKTSSTEQQRLGAKRKKAALTPEEQKTLQQQDQRKRVQRFREKKKNEKESNQRKENGKQQTQRCRGKKRLCQEAKDKDKEERESIQERSYDYNIPVDMKGPIQQARKHEKEIMKVDGKPNSLRIPVCVLCDRLIIGCETIHKITGERLCSQSQRISVKAYENYHQVKLRDELISQYNISGHNLDGLLLSPRAKKSWNKDGGIAFEACSQCYKAWQNSDTDNPPKHAISNGFAIGHIPEEIIKQENITEVMSSFIAPVRPFAYVFAYTAGAHKSIRGHCSFFEVNLSHVGSTMNHFLKTGANPLVYVVLCGRMTPKQKQIVKDRAKLDTKLMMILLEWFVNKSGHPGYEGVTPPSECPMPNIIADEDTPNNTDEEHDPDLEKKFAGASFHFTSNYEPQEDTGVYETNQQFVKAMLDRTMPTLLVNGGNYTDLQELLLENIAPMQFPFGQGGPKSNRRTHISPEACYQHYCKLSLPQFMRGDFLLILNHMYNRQRSFQTASIRCRSISFGSTLAEKLSTLKKKDFDQVMFQKHTNQKVTGTAGEYIKAVEASCKPVGYSALNAKQNRQKHFAMDTYFGGHSIFLTTTPCDERTIRVQVFANAGTEVKLPKLGDWDDEGHMDDCKASFNVRKNARSDYPGACSLVYQHLMQIVTECLIGWDPKTQSGRQGVFGVPIAYSRTDEEQGRKTLHSHWQVWIKNFNKCRDALFHSDKEKRKMARDALISYIDKVVCASYGTDFVVTHNCGKEEQGQIVTKPMHEILCEVEDKNTLRKAKHQDHCLVIRGKVIECKLCEKSFSPSECINMGINHIRQQASSRDHHVDSNIRDGRHSSPVMKKEWLDHVVIRYPFDFDEEGSPTDALEEQKQSDGAGYASNEWLYDRKLRRDLLHFVFDEHDCTHRATCFKGGKAECRGNLPEMASEKSIIFDKSAIDALNHDHRCVKDNEGEKNILCHHLNGEIEEKSQYTILPRRANGSQFLNQHNVPISDVLACNTNVTLGDPSHTYYTTLYKSKDTQAEDKMAYHRVNASLGRRLWRAQQQQQQQQQQHEEQQQQQQEQHEEKEGRGNKQEETDINDQTCPIEGLGRVMTGINALLSRDIVSSTMAHLLISQGGERFTYSHEFYSISLQNIENVLEEKKTMYFRLRRNWNNTEKKTISWADCWAYDYIFRPDSLENLSVYEYAMWYKKEYKSFKELNGESTRQPSSPSLVYKFNEGHQGRKYCHLSKRKHPVIPIISMTTNLCNVKTLCVLDDSPTDEGTLQHRERYAKTALMLFYPFRKANDLIESGTYWQKFVDIEGTKAYEEALHAGLGGNPMTKQFWNRGRLILQNIETRNVAEKEMKRPKSKITYLTETPKSTGQRKKDGVDKEDEFDIDIADFFENKSNDEGFQAAELRALADTDLRSHVRLMKRANVSECSAINSNVDDDASIIATGNSSSNNETSNSNSEYAQPTNNHQQPSEGTFEIRYNDILTFIQGSLLVGSNDTSVEDTHMSTDGDESVYSAPTPVQQHLKKIPKLQEIARGKNSKYNLDDKQYIAYQIVCCTFLLQLVMEGDNYDTKLGDMLGASLEPLAECDQQTKDSVVKILKAMGGKEHLVMFLTGAAGCGKSTTMEAAQFYCHKFCTAIAVAFNDYSFYFTATTGSAAALFGGTTIHSAAHLNKNRINDEMRAAWRDDVRILIIDEISFFKASDVAKLDRQLKKLTGRYDMAYGGVSIVFSGDFHQLKPICAEDDVLYSDSPAASLWENTINCAIFLDNSHRFKDDPLYGELLARMRLGEDTLEDRELINSRVVNATLTLPENAPDACFACSTNKERNGVAAASFKRHIEDTHPTITDDNPPPDHTLIIEASISKKTGEEKRTQQRKVPAAFHDAVITQLGDDDIKATEFGASGTKVEPALRTYPGCHFMCVTNKDLDQGRGNGTLCKLLRVKLRRNGEERRWKNWDGKKVWSVSVDDVEWVEFEHYPTLPGAKRRTFKLEPREFSATIKLPLTEDLSTTVGNAKIKQVPVNSNVATTGHKLQGMSKDIIIVNSWNYRCANWVYVVLSRVRTLAGLYLIQPLDLERSFNVPENLIRFETRLKELKERPILDLLGYNQPNQNSNN